MVSLCVSRLGSPVRATGFHLLDASGNPAVAFRLPAHTDVERIAVGSSGMVGLQKRLGKIHISSHVLR